MLLAAKGVQLPPGALVEDANAFTDLSPPTYSADLVISVDRTPTGAEACAIVEVQGSIDDDKRYAWPRYAATMHAQRRCPTWVVVIATNGAVAAWARQPVDTFQPGWGFVPIVIGPEDVPRIIDLAAARAAPELAVLSAVMHGRGDDGTQVAVAAIEAARLLDTERRRLYTDLAFGSLHKVARAVVEAIMRERGYEPLTEEIRESLHKGRAEGLRSAILAACRALDVPWTDDRERAVTDLDEAGLAALHEAIVRSRAWPSH